MKKVIDLLNKTTVKNGMWLYALQFFNTILPLITLPYITRILGASKYGVFSIVLNLVAYLQVAVEYGFGLSATRRVALIKDDNQLSRLFSSVISSRFVLYINSLVLTGVYILLTENTHETNLCMWILSISLIAYCLQENWLFQGKQEMKFISITSMIARLATTVLIFVLIKKPDDLVLYCIFYSLSPIITNLLGTIIAVNRYKIKWVWLSVKDVIEALKDGVYVFFTNLSSKTFGAIGITFLGIYASDYDVGVYSALYKIPYVLMLLWSPISQVVYPITSKRITESYNDGKILINKLRMYCLIAFGAISILVALFAEPISQIAFGNEYATKFYIVYPLLIWMLLGINNNFLGIQTLVGSGHDKAYSVAFQIGVVATIVFNFVLIYFRGMEGAAVAPALSEGMLCILLLWQKNKVDKEMQIKELK